VYVLEQKVKSIGEVTSGGSHEWVKSFKKDSMGLMGYNSFDYICGGGGGLEPRIYMRRIEAMLLSFFFRCWLFFLRCIDLLYIIFI
jgi:hypothetical protein